MTTTNVIAIDGLRKSYGKTVVLADVSLAVPEGSIFGLLGPNGAGKTTLMEILEGIRAADAGSVSICGLDPARHAAKLKHLVGVQLQETQLSDLNTVAEIFDLFASFYRTGNDWKRIADVVKLKGRERTLYKDLSGGQKQLLAIGLALLGEPRLLFLDEPTVGLDVHARLDVYEAIRRIKAEGKTVFLSTHYLEEAENLCDLVGILDQGRIVAFGSPKKLVQNDLQSGQLVSFELTNFVREEDIRALFHVTEVVQENGKYTVLVSNVEQFTQALSQYAADSRNPILSMSVNQSKLQEIFIKLTRSPSNA